MVDINTNPQPVNIIPFQKAEIAENKQEYIDAIHHWCQTYDLAETLSRQELGAMKAFDRIDAQRKAIIDILTRYYRNHRKADVAPGVAVIITLLSDNEKGMATVSQPTLAKLFDRSVSSIADAQKRLRDDKIIITGRGRYAGSTPVIPRFVTQSYNHLTWMVEALAQTSNHPVGRYDCQSSGGTPSLSQSSGGALSLEGVQSSGGTLSYFTKIDDDKEACSRKSCCGLKGLAKGATVLLSTMAPVAAAADTIPLEPPAYVESQKPEFEYFTVMPKLLEAAGEDIRNSQEKAIQDSKIPKAWIEAGLSLENDILPAIRETKAPPRTVRSWNYYGDIIKDYVRIRNKATQTAQDIMKLKNNDWLTREASRNAGRKIEPRNEQ